MNSDSCCDNEVDCQNQCALSIDGLEFLGNELELFWEHFCPVCSDANLQVASINGTQACGCANCQGFLIDSISLGIIINVLRAEYQGTIDKPVMIDTKELEKIMNCPACFDKMYTHPYHGPGNVVVNSCSGCQLNWLDAGELAKIIRAPGRRGPCNNQN